MYEYRAALVHVEPIAGQDAVDTTLEGHSDWSLTIPWSMSK